MPPAHPSAGQGEGIAHSARRAATKPSAQILSGQPGTLDAGVAVGPAAGEAAYWQVVAKASGTPATTALTKAGIAHRLHAYAHDPKAASYGLEAAELLGIEPARVFKTLLVEADGQLVVGIVPVDRHLDLKAIASAAGAKRAVMAQPAAAERATGYVIGGISPIGQKRRLLTVLDATALHHDGVLVSGGRRGLDVELAPADLVALTGARVAPIAR